MNTIVKKAMALLLSLLICLPLPSAVKVHTIGDSTMATYDDNSPKIGWGQVLQQFFIYNDTPSADVRARVSTKKNGAVSKDRLKRATT